MPVTSGAQRLNDLACPSPPSFSTFTSSPATSSAARRGSASTKSLTALRIPCLFSALITDGLPTDILGAAKYGIDAVYVSHGIHAGEPVPNDFAWKHGLGDWRPVMTVEGLA